MLSYCMIISASETHHTQNKNGMRAFLPNVPYAGISFKYRWCLAYALGAKLQNVIHTKHADAGEGQVMRRNPTHSTSSPK